MTIFCPVCGRPMFLDGDGMIYTCCTNLNAEMVGGRHEKDMLRMLGDVRVLQGRESAPVRRWDMRQFVSGEG